MYGGNCLTSFLLPPTLVSANEITNEQFIEMNTNELFGVPSCDYLFMFLQSSQMERIC